MNDNAKLIETLEEALVIWSRIWGNSFTEYRMAQAEKEIAKINRQLAELSASE